MEYVYLTGPLKGTKDHGPITQEMLALEKAGIISITRFKTQNGVPGYVQRLAAGHNAQPAPVVVEWGVNEQARPPVVMKRVNGETFYLDSPPADAPESVKRRFAELVIVEATGGSAGALAVAQRQQHEYEARVKHAKKW